MASEQAHTNKTVSRGVLFSIAFLITGNLIGAGILALPVNTGLAGLLPALTGMVIMCALMYFTAMVLAGEANATKQENFNYPSLYHKYLGSAGKWVAVLANLIILYGLLTAYLTGGTTIITNIAGWKSATAANGVMLACFVILTGMTLLGVQLIKRCNALLMILIWGTFALIVFIAGRHIEPGRLTYQDWHFLPITIPIIITSFHFHNIIPTVCTDMKWQKGPIAKAMLIGMIIGFAMNAIWIIVGIGALPMAGPGSLDQAFQANIPATVPLSQLIGSNFFITCAMIFAFLAIVTSYVANGLGLMGFIRDLLENFFGTKNKILVAIFSFGPPLLVSFLYPNIFLKAMDVVGGVGIVTLFGILPSIIAYKKAKKPAMRVLSLVICAAFSLFLVMELCQEAGLLKIKPEVEYWDHSNLTPPK